MEKYTLYIVLMSVRMIVVVLKGMMMALLYWPEKSIVLMSLSVINPIIGRND